MNYKVTPKGFRLVQESVEGDFPDVGEDHVRTLALHMANALCTILEYYPDGRFLYFPACEEFQNVTPFLRRVLLARGYIEEDFQGDYEQLCRDTRRRVLIEERRKDSKWRWRAGLDESDYL